MNKAIIYIFRQTDNIKTIQKSELSVYRTYKIKVPGLIQYWLGESYMPHILLCITQLDKLFFFVT